MKISDIKFGVLVLGWCIVPFILLWSVLMTVMATDLRDKCIMLEDELGEKSISSDYWRGRYENLEFDYQVFQESVMSDEARYNQGY